MPNRPIATTLEIRPRLLHQQLASAEYLANLVGMMATDRNVPSPVLKQAEGVRWIRVERSVSAFRFVEETLNRRPGSTLEQLWSDRRRAAREMFQNPPPLVLSQEGNSLPGLTRASFQKQLPELVPRYLHASHSRYRQGFDRFRTVRSALEQRTVGKRGWGKEDLSQNGGTKRLRLNREAMIPALGQDSALRNQIRPSVDFTAPCFQKLLFFI